MSIKADRDSRYLFAPRALTNAPYALDKIELKCASVHLPLIPRTEIDTFLYNLNGSVFNGLHNRTLRVATRRWLFQGKVKFRPASDNRPGIEAEIHLIINPTRYLQSHRWVSDRVTRQRMMNNPNHSLTRERSGEVINSDANASCFSWDRRDNLLVRGSTGNVGFDDWSDRTREYFETILSLIRIEFSRATNRTLASGASHLDFMTPLKSANWSISQIEYYWEFRVENAIQKINAISPTVSEILRHTYEAAFSTNRRNHMPPMTGTEENAPYLTGELGRQKVFAKLYAKASQVLRFEIAYKERPLSKVRLRPGERRSGIARDVDGLFENITRIGNDASDLANTFWTEFWDVHGVEAIGDNEALEELLNIVFRAPRNDIYTAAELLSVLRMNRTIAPQIRGGDRQALGEDVCQYLAAPEQGVLRACRFSSNASQRFCLTPRYRAVIMRLAEAFSQNHALDENEGETETTEEARSDTSTLLRDEDPTSIRGVFEERDTGRRTRRGPRYTLESLEGGPIFAPIRLRRR